MLRKPGMGARAGYGCESLGWEVCGRGTVADGKKGNFGVCCLMKILYFSF
jgi:hypothetical protein